MSHKPLSHIPTIERIALYDNRPGILSQVNRVFREAIEDYSDTLWKRKALRRGKEILERLIEANWTDLSIRVASIIAEQEEQNEQIGESATKWIPFLKRAIHKRNIDSMKHLAFLHDRSPHQKEFLSITDIAAFDFMILHDCLDVLRFINMTHDLAVWILQRNLATLGPKCAYHLYNQLKLEAGIVKLLVERDITPFLDKQLKHKARHEFGTILIENGITMERLRMLEANDLI